LLLKEKLPLALLGSIGFGAFMLTMCTHAPSSRSRPSAGESSRSRSTPTRCAFSFAAAVWEDRVMSPPVTMGFGSNTLPRGRA